MQNSEDLSASKPASPTFDETIAQIEKVAGDFLTGPGRIRMEGAFERDPEAFTHLMRKALAKRGAHSLLGLFVRIVDDELALVSRKLAAARDEAEAARADYEALAARVASGEGPGYLSGDEVWLRKVGVCIEDADDVRTMLEERGVGDRGIGQLLELWHEIRFGRAA